jgi:CRISPR-associated protein Cas6
MPIIDLAFHLQGEEIPLDYGYALFSALCRIVPRLHGDLGVGVHPIRGMRLAPRRLTLVPQSCLRLRLPSEEIAPYLALAGSRLDVEGSPLLVGIPRVEPLRPSACLCSRLVTIGRLTEPDAVLAGLRRHLSALGVAAEPTSSPRPTPPAPASPRAASCASRASASSAIP